MLQAFRLQQGDATASYQQMKAALGEPVSSLPLEREAAATSSSWWLRSVVGTGAPGIAAVEASFAGLARGRAAAEQRASAQFTEFDGHVPEAGVVLDPCAAGNAFSVTELEKAATLSVPLLPEARPRHAAGGRSRARQGRLAGSADARLGAARPLRGPPAPLPRPPAVRRTWRRMAPG